MHSPSTVIRNVSGIMNPTTIDLEAEGVSPADLYHSGGQTKGRNGNHHQPGIGCFFEMGVLLDQ